MSNARNLSNLLGTGTTIATAKLADDAVTSAKIADDAVVSAAIATDAVGADALSSSAIAVGDLPNGSVVKVSNFITNSSTSVSGVNDSGTYTNITNLSSLSHSMVDSTNQILIFYMINWSGGGSTNASVRFRILDGSNNIIASNAWIGQQTNMADGNARSRASQISGCVNYDPDASSVTLNAQVNAPVGGGGVKVNGNYNDSADSNLRSTITVVEYVA